MLRLLQEGIGSFIYVATNRIFAEPHVQPGSRCRVKADVYSL